MMFVFSNLATSLDGKICTAERTHYPLGTAIDREEMQIIRRQADAILMGAASLRAFRRPCLVEGAIRQPLNVIVSSKLEDISPDWPFFKTRDLTRLLLVTGPVSAARGRAFEKTCELVRLKPGGRSRPTAALIMDALAARGVKRLLIEGGGATMWDFVEHNLIDEYHVTLTPRLLGGAQAPTLVDGEGFPARKMLNLKLLQCEVVGDEVYLIYQKTRRRG